MIPYPHQEELSDLGLDIIKDYGIVYYAMEERTGKTLTSILTVEKSKANRCLIITKLKAVSGWTDTLASFEHLKSYDVIHYQGLYSQHKVQKKIKGKLVTVTEYRLKPQYNHKLFDVVILDESHAFLSAYPKVGKIARIVQDIAYNKPVIFLSATPSAQGNQLLFHQLNMSKYSPFDHYKNFYTWFKDYGIPEIVYTGHGQKIKYDTVKGTVWSEVKHLFISKTRAELDFEHEPEDIVHYVELDEDTRELYNSCQEYEMLIYDDGIIEIPLDSSMKLRTTLHQIEGGVFKQEDGSSGLLLNMEKINAIYREFGDTESLVIMYHYKAELDKLREYFTHARLLQGTSYAEGVDLSGYDDLAIYSQDFSTAKHSQRRARQANKARKTPIKVHFYIVRGAISEQVYNTVALNKENFIDKLYKRNRL